MQCLQSLLEAVLRALVLLPGRVYDHRVAVLDLLPAEPVIEVAEGLVLARLPLDFVQSQPGLADVLEQVLVLVDVLLVLVLEW